MLVKPNKYVGATVDAEGNVDDTEDALADIYKTIRPGDPSTHESARGLLASIFYDLRRYDLARVGRYKMNKKLGINLPMDDRPERLPTLRIDDRIHRPAAEQLLARRRDELLRRVRPEAQHLGGGAERHRRHQHLHPVLLRRILRRREGLLDALKDR